MNRRSFFGATLLAGTTNRLPADAGHAAAAPLTSDVKTELTPESLRMPRTSIAFSDRMLRVFNGRGSISLRDRTVTGLQSLLFPPIDVRDYRFSLTLRDEKSKTLIEDTVQDYYERFAQTGKGPHPLGLNFTRGTPQVLLWQRADWQPGALLRTGTYHNVKVASFAIETTTTVSAESDEVYVEVRIRNRRAEPLLPTVMPRQSASELRLQNADKRAGPVGQSDAFTLASDQIAITVASDLPIHEAEGWKWEIPGHGAGTARFAILLRQAKTAAPDVHAPAIADKMRRADSSLRERLHWAAERLPRVVTANKAFNDLYYRSILSVLEARWERENFVVRPFHAIGAWIFSVPWDTSYASELLAILEPEALRETFLAYIRAGVLTSSWLTWHGKPMSGWYAQNPFAILRILKDYLRQTGDFALLDFTVNGTTVLEWMKRMGRELVKRYGRPDGLLDFGEGSEKMLEIRTSGYEHVVAATNGMALAYFRQIAEWCRARQDGDAAEFNRWAGRLQQSLHEKLWNDEVGWFENLYPDGSRHLVWSYHLFDLLDAGVFSPAQQKRIVSRLRDGEFLAPFGMYSISKLDEVHWDLEDVDWGGGGQYTGMPLRIAESLYRLGSGELAWNILERCTRWTRMYPYIPQEIFGDFPGYPEVEMPLEIAAGSGAQAILFGVFGLRPRADGSLEVAPSYQAALGNASMTGYQFRGHSYDVAMNRGEFKVYRDGKLAGRKPYPGLVRF